MRDLPEPRHDCCLSVSFFPPKAYHCFNTSPWHAEILQYSVFEPCQSPRGSMGRECRCHDGRKLQDGIE